LAARFIGRDEWIGSAEKDDLQGLIHALMFRNRIDIQLGHLPGTVSPNGDTSCTNSTMFTSDTRVSCVGDDAL
jgi:hypothetical protein